MSKNLTYELSRLLSEYKSTATILKQELRENELEKLNQAIERMEKLQVLISVFGETNSGKSALLNSLMGFDNEDANPPFSVNDNINTWSNEIAQKNKKRWQEVSGLDLILQDTPGIAGDNPNHLKEAVRLANNSDIILYVISEPVKGEQVQIMKGLIKTLRPILFVINQIDIRREKQIQATVDDLLQKVSNLRKDSIVLAAGYPRSGPPQINDLINKLTDLVRINQESLIETTLDISLEEALSEATKRKEKRLEEQRKKIEQENRRIKEEKERKIKRAETLVERYALGASASAAVMPFGLDFLTTTLIGGGMFVHVANMYNQNIEKSAVETITNSLKDSFFSTFFVGSTGTFIAFQTLSKGLKLNPVTYLIGSALDATFTYFFVFIIGMIFSNYCVNNMSWEKDVNLLMKEYIKEYIYKLFIDKLPNKIREKVLKLINPELL